MEAIFLDCGAGGPQLKRNPLGAHDHYGLCLHQLTLHPARSVAGDRHSRHLRLRAPSHPTPRWVVNELRAALNYPLLAPPRCPLPQISPGARLGFHRTYRLADRHSVVSLRDARIPRVAPHHHSLAGNASPMVPRRRDYPVPFDTKWESVNRAPNTRLKLSARGRHLCRKAQWKPSILIVAPAGRSLSATR